MTHDHDDTPAQDDTGLRALEQRLRDQAPDAMTPAPDSLRSRVLGEIWETTPDRSSVLARIGRPALAAAAVLALTTGALIALSTLAARPFPPTGSGGAATGGEAPAILSFLDEARLFPERLPERLAAIPGSAGVGEEAERMLADARRAAQRFGQRLVPVRSVFLGDRDRHADDPAPATPATHPPVERRPG